MLTFPKYDNYQETGIQWLGEIPTHWSLLNNKYLFHEKKATVGKNSSDYTLLSLTLQGVIARDMENPQGKFPAEFNTYKIADVDDIVFCLFDIEETPRTVGHVGQRGMITGAYTIVECNERISSRYLTYYYLSLDFDKRLKPLYTGLRKVIQRGTFMGMKSPVPPRKEQDRIAAFLDEKTREIDEAIAKKRRLIALLQEQKAILINEAVTKGLDRDRPMKDSGVDWIGSIPAHWQVKRLKHLFHEVNNRTDTGKETLLSLRMYRGLVPHNEVSDKPISDNDLVGYKQIEVGQLVMNRMRAAVGLFAVGTQSGLVSPDYAVFNIKEGIDANFYMHLFKTNLMGTIFRIESKGMGTGSSGFLRLYTDRFGIIPVPFPPICEQSQIVEHIETIAKEVARTIAKVEEELELLQELRRITISEAVTGKIKV